MTMLLRFHQAIVLYSVISLAVTGCSGEGGKTDQKNGNGGSTFDSTSGATTVLNGGGAGGSDSGGRSSASGTTAGSGSSSIGGAGTSIGSPCNDPVFVTSDTNGGWSDGGYYVHNNMWNSSATLGPETLYACSYRNWYVVSNQTNEAGAVKTYPNVHKDYEDVPISSFKSITSSFAEASPHVGIYNVAYDIWTNGVATSGSTEFMIWTENFNQVPSGNKAASVTLGGRTYDVWKTSNSRYIAFVPTTVFTSGTLDILAFFNYATSQGWFPANSTLGQICFGVEIVSTGGAQATFQFTDFSIATE